MTNTNKAMKKVGKARIVKGEYCVGESNVTVTRFLAELGDPAHQNKSLADICKTLNLDVEEAQRALTWAANKLVE